MDLIARIDQFFVQYDKDEEKPEGYIARLLPILNDLAADVSNEERLSINLVCASLESDRDEIKILINDREEESLESLKKIRKNVRITIRDLRSGEILKRYRKKPSARSEVDLSRLRDSLPVIPAQGEVTNKAEGAGRASPERPVGTEGDPMKVAISVVQRLYPNASTEEVLLRAEEYFKAASSRGQRDEAVTTRKEIRH